MKCIFIVSEYMIHKLYINTTDNKQPRSDECVVYVLSHSVNSNSLQVVLQPNRFLSPWDCLVKDTRMACHFLLHVIFLTQRLNPCSCIGRRIFSHCTTGETLIRSVVVQKNKVKDLNETNG